MNEAMEGIPTFVQFLASMGVGGILAYLIYKQSDKNAHDYANTIKGFYELERGRSDMLMHCMTENTKQTSINTTVLQALHRRLDKDAIDREREGV